MTPATGGQPERVQQIVAAAATVMGRAGFAAASIKEIALEAGCAQGLVHYYFATKEDLLAAVVESLCAEIQADVVTAFADTGAEPLARIAVGLERTRARFEQRPEVMRLVCEMVAVSTTNTAARSHLVALYRRVGDLTQQIVHEINVQLPVALPVPESAFADVIVAAIDGLALRVVIDPDFDLAAAYSALNFLLIAAGATGYAVAGEPIGLEDLTGLMMGRSREAHRADGAP